MILTEQEEHLLNTPLARLSLPDRKLAFALIDRIFDFNWAQPFPESKGNPIIHDKDISFKNGPVQSPATREHFNNRAEWDDHLKRNNLTEFGNDQKVKPRPVKMRDMNLKPAIAEAIKEVSARYDY